MDTGFNMRQLAAEEKNKQKKKPKETKGKDDQRQQAFDINLNDARFGAIFNNRNYHIDRSNPDYKPTATMKAIESEATKRRYDETTGAPRKELAKKESEPGWDDSRLASLKRKVENYPASKQKQKQMKK